MTAIFIRPPRIDPAILDTSRPLIVTERCASPQLREVWMALRWLIALMPNRKGFSVREIADRGGVNYRKVGRWCRQLEELELIERVGEVQVPGLDTPRPIYTIDFPRLHQASLDVLDDVLIRYQTNAPPPPRVSDEQLSYLEYERDQPGVNVAFAVEPGDVRDCERDQPGVNVACAVEPGDVRDCERDQPGANVVFAVEPGDVRDCERDVRDCEHGEREREREREREARPPRAAEGVSQTASFLPNVAPPPTPPNMARVSAHPFQLWMEAISGAPQALDFRHLEHLAEAHNLQTNGYGLYWVGKAILAASLGKDLSINKVYGILNRWRDEQSYGSDAPQHTVNREQRNGDKRKRTERRASNGNRDVDPNRLTWDELPDYLKEP